MLRSFFSHCCRWGNHRLSQVSSLAPLDLEGTYSAFSGIVIDVGVGNPPQELRLALDFTSSSTSRLFKDECPPFVPMCFSPDQSRSFGDGSDEISFFDRIEWAFIKFSEIGGKFPEAAGAISAGPESPVFKGRTIHLLDGASGPSIQELQDDKPGTTESSDDILVRLHVRAGSTRWITGGRLRINKRSLHSPRLVEYNPSEEDLVLPMSLWQTVLDKLRRSGDEFEINESGRLVIATTDTPMMNLDLWFDVDELIALPRTLVRSRATKDGRGRGRWNLRVRFDSAITDRIVIGRILTRCTEGVSLDYSRKEIRFHESSTHNDIVLFDVPRPLIPVVQRPVALEESRIDGVASRLIFNKGGEFVISSMLETGTFGTGSNSVRWHAATTSQSIARLGRTTVVLLKSTEVPPVRGQLL